MVEVAARPEAINEGEFALNEATEIIDYFADYFKTAYPLIKSSNLKKIIYSSKILCYPKTLFGQIVLLKD